MLTELRLSLEPVLARFHDDLRVGNYDGELEASTAVQVTTLLRFATGQVPLDLFEALTGKPGAPDVIVDDLTAALTRTIEELTRPVDAIKHQAKTVTVGISRSDEGLLNGRLAIAVLAAGAERDQIAYKTLKVLSVLDPAVAAVTGYTRYSIHGDPESRRCDAAGRRPWRGGARHLFARRHQPDPRRHEAPSRLRARVARVARAAATDEQ